MKSCSSASKFRLAVVFSAIFGSIFSVAQSVPLTGKRYHRQLEFGRGMDFSLSNSMAMASSAGFGGSGMSMSESMAMAMKAGVINVNGFPIPYFDTSMSMAAADAFNLRARR